jgi:spectinomycin phosphotransferase
MLIKPDLKDEKIITFLFLSDEGGDDRMQVLEHLQPNFLPNGTIERAYHADKMRNVS